MARRKRMSRTGYMVGGEFFRTKKHAMRAGRKRLKAEKGVDFFELAKAKVIVLSKPEEIWK